MQNIVDFDYKTFQELEGIVLCKYMDQLLTYDAVHFCTDTIRRLRDGLPTYDEVHLVYGITFGIKYSPQLFAEVLPKYLGDARGSVWAAAYNGLNQMPDQYVTPDLVESIREISTANPNKKWVADVLSRLEQRLSGK